MRKVSCQTGEKYSMFVKEVTDLSEWDDLVEHSSQGTIFSTSKWLKTVHQPYHIYGCYQGSLIGGMANFDKPAPLTPFQGILVRDSDMKYTSQLSLHNEIATALIPYAPSNFYNHWTFPDVRPFKWAGWSTDIRYTFVVDLTNLPAVWEELEKQTRYEINHARKTYTSWMTPDIGVFDGLYSETFKRKGLERPIDSDFVNRVNWNCQAVIFCTCSLDAVGSMAVIIEDTKRAYYILGASGEGHTSSLTLWYAFERLAKEGVKEIDLVGCNNQEIGLFKRGFGGKLVSYYGVKK